MAKTEPLVKTTFELPLSLLARVKAYAALRKIPMRVVLQDALTAHISRSNSKNEAEPAWRELFGAFKDDPETIDQVQAIIDEEFSRIDPEDWK